MANTYVAIATTTVGAAGTNTIEFTSIPQTYTDLLIKLSSRPTTGAAGGDLSIGFNSSTSSFTSRYLLGSGSAASSSTGTVLVGLVGSTTTASTFASTEIYIPNYTSSNYKSYSVESCEEANATLAYMAILAGLWSNTAAITSIQLTNARPTFAQYSTATLYGIKNS